MSEPIIVQEVKTLQTEVTNARKTKATLKDKIDEIDNTLTQHTTDMGAVANLTTTSKTLVTAVNELHDDINNVVLGEVTDGSITDLKLDPNGIRSVVVANTTNIGTIANLTTTATNLVGAVNEHDTEIGNISLLETTATDLVGATNEVVSSLADIVTLAPAPNGVDDTVNLNALFFNGNKKIYFPHDGQYIISSTVNLFSNTTVEIKGNVEFLLKANSPCYMFVADGISFENIKWNGGVINGNDENQGAETGEDFDKVKGMVFKNVTNLIVENLTVKNTRGHGINHWNCNRVVFRDIQFEQSLSTLRPNGGSRRDGITGMSSNVLIDNISGFTDDDLIAILSGVDWAGANTTPVDIENIEIRNIKAKKHSSGRNPWRGVAVYTSGGYTTKNININGINGDMNYGIIHIGNYGKPTSGTVKNINISNVYGESVYHETFDTGMIGITDVTIDNININNITCNLTTDINTNKFLIAINDSEINKININNVAYNVYIATTNYNTILREYTSTGSTRNIKTCSINNVALKFFNATYTNGFLYIKNNISAQTTVLNINNYYVSPPNHGQNGATYTTTKSLVFCNNSCKLTINDKKIPALNEFVTAYEGDLLNDPRYVELRYTNNQFCINKPVNVTTVTNYATFDSNTKTLIVDGTSTSGYFRIQDKQAGDIYSRYPNGYTVTIKRIDNNVDSHPYVKMTSNEFIDGTDSHNLSAYQAMTFQYNANTSKWVKL